MKLAKLRFEAKRGNFMLSKLTDIETGLVIPIRSIKIESDVRNHHHEITAIVEVPIEELDIDGVLTQINTFDAREEEIPAERLEVLKQ